MKNYKRIKKTLTDIGIKRIIQRIIYELKIKFNSSFFRYFTYYLITYKKYKNLNFLILYPSNKTKNHEAEVSKIKKINFSFINQKKCLNFPINWNNNNWDRLWQFNLHYFDWARKLIEDNKKIDFKKNIYLKTIINDWIDNNSFGKGDGWHSYTISIRVRNWLWIFKYYPEILEKKFIKSIWLQILWLEAHPESCHSGNHFLENLITVCIGSLYFDNKTAKKFYLLNMRKLELELNKQILNDGGHCERSVSYHILILDRLVDLACTNLEFKKNIPNWLKKHISRMNIWLLKVSFNYSITPRFNDTSMEHCPSVNEVTNYASLLLNKNYFKKNSSNNYEEPKIFRKMLLKKAGIKTTLYKSKEIEKLNPLFTNLKDTGWMLVSPGFEWNLFFKYGKSGEKDLPAHMHSDMCSFDLFYKDKIIFGEAGISTYNPNKIREYERSGQSHNILQLGYLNKRKKMQWIESVDVFDTFKAGYKSEPTKMEFSKNNNRSITLKGGHTGFNFFGADYYRLIKIKEFSSKKIILMIQENLNLRKNFYFNIYLHLGQNINIKELCKKIKIKISSNTNYKINKINTHIAEKFGERIKRKSLVINGYLESGNHKIKIILPLEIDEIII